MATSYYAHPAPSHFQPSPHHSSHHSSHKQQRGYRLCDQCGVAETPAVPRFRLCGGCMTTQYCSSDCQKVHWPAHKQICQHTAQQLSGLKQQHLSASYPEESVTKYLRKFCSLHCDLLGWAGFQALQLKRMPANIRQNALLIDLAYNEHGDSHHRFSISSTHVVPRTYIRDPLVVADIQRREERCRLNGGIGTAVILIQCGSVSQVMPVEVDPPAKIGWETRDDWALILHQFVELGRGDFKPPHSSRR